MVLVGEVVGEILFRRYRVGDEEEMVEVLGSCFDGFRDYGLRPGVWLEYDSRDHGFSKEKALVAEHNGRIVGHVQLVFMELKMGEGVFVVNGGVSNVCTHLEYRGRGVATR